MAERVQARHAGDEVEADGEDPEDGGDEHEPLEVERPVRDVVREARGRRRSRTRRRGPRQGSGPPCGGRAAVGAGWSRSATRSVTRRPLATAVGWRGRAAAGRSRTAPVGTSRRITTTTTNGNQSDACVLIRLFAASSRMPRISPPTIAPTGRAGAADHQRHEPGDPVGVAEVRVRVGDRADQHAGDAREDPRAGERDHRHQRRCSRRAPRPSPGRTRPPCPTFPKSVRLRTISKRGGECDRDADRDDLLQGQGRAADVDARARSGASGTTATSGPR